MDKDDTHFELTLLTIIVKVRKKDMFASFKRNIMPNLNGCI